MNSFEERASLEAAIKGRDHYQWGVVLRPFHLARRGGEVEFLKGDEIGVRLSSSKTQYRLVNHRLGISVVFTLAATPDLRKSLLKNVKWQAIRVADPGKRIISTEEVHPLFSINVEAAAEILAALALKGLGKRHLTVNSDWNIRQVMLELEANASYSSNFLGWYSSGPEPYAAKDLFAFTSKVFTCQSEKVDLYRWTSLKSVREELPVGYAFRLDTSHKYMLQSWSRHPAGLKSFAAGYLLRGRFPKKLVCVSDEAWVAFRDRMSTPAALDSYSQHLRVGLDRVVDKASADAIMKNIRGLLKTQVILMVRTAFSYPKEREVVVNVSTGFKPLCEVLQHV